MKPAFFSLLVGFLSLPVVHSLGQNVSIAFNASAGALQLNGGQILVAVSDHWGVIKAASDLATDFGRATGKNLTFAAANATEPAAVYQYRPTTNNVNYTIGDVKSITAPPYTGTGATLSKTSIIAGTVGRSGLIDSLISAGKLDVTSISGQWESFMTQIVQNPTDGVSQALIIAGADVRGTIFGIYDISEQIGVSPFYFWADVPTVKQSTIYAMNITKVQGSPTVKYRGFFLNDEQPALTDWVNNNFPPVQHGAGFNHNFYALIFEVLLRLRGNYLWPTTWGSMICVDDTESQPLADATAIVLGSSHTEPMQRATNEWGFYGTGQWEYDTNNASVNHFFTYGAERAKPYQNSTLFTMAMRGVGDTAITLSQQFAIDELVDTVSSQRSILETVFNSTGTPITDIPQMWCLYKEVQGYYDAGMTVPDDITLLFADDNWGNIRRAALSNETSRSGGTGIYYHFDYVGNPMDYKWINTIQLSKTAEQMQLAYARGTDRIWIANVGDMKGLEIPINHFLDLAYDTPQVGYDTTSWLTTWATRDFGAEIASNISAIMIQYSTLAARRKFELLDPTIYSTINYHEVENVLAEWSSLGTQAQAVYDALPAASQAAFFELVLHPVLAGGTVHKIYLGAGLNSLYTEQKRTSTNANAMQVLNDFNQDANLTNTFHSILDGKWKGIMSQTHLGYNAYWQQPMRNTMPQVAFVQHLEALSGPIGFGVEGSNATIPGDDFYHANSGVNLVLPPMDPYGPTRYIDVFSRGEAGCQWTLTPLVSYLTVSPSSGYTGGENGTDDRVTVSVDWAIAPPAPNSTVANIQVNTTCQYVNYNPYGHPVLQVPINNTAVPANFTGFVESDGHISIEMEHASRNSSAGKVSYTVLPNYGRTLSGVTLMPVTAATQPVGSGPILEYDFYAFTNMTAVPANITLHISPSLNAYSDSRALKYGIAIDAETPKVNQFVSNTTQGNLPTGWTGAVSDAVWGVTSGNMTTTQHNFGPGFHTIKVWAIEPGVVFQKMIINLGGVRASYLGPPESFRAGVDTIGTYNGASVPT